MMVDTYKKVSQDLVIDSGPTKYDVFKSKSKSIVSPKSLALPVPQIIGQYSEKNGSIYGSDYDYAESIAK